jgi:hypothetical protein
VALHKLDTNLNAEHSTDSCVKYNPTKIAYWRADALAVSEVSLSFLSRKIVRLRAQADRLSALLFSKKTFRGGMFSIAALRFIN